jgi:hypothetical protein
MLLFALTGTARAESPPCMSGAHGSQTVGSGQNLVVCGGQISGSIIVHTGASLDVENARVTGGVKASGATHVRLCGDTIGGNVQIDLSSGPVFVGDPDDGCAANTIGPLNVFHNTHGVDVSDNTIHGSMSFDENAGSDDSSFCDGSCTFEPEVGDNMVFGAIDCEDNGGSPPGVFTDGGVDRARGAILGDCAHEGTMK